MDRRERYPDPIEAIRTAQDGHQAQIWTALPGIVQSFDADAVTVSVQPAIKGRVRDKEQKISTVDLPMLTDVPVVFPRGGGVTLTFPVKEGDECLVVFSSRCIDGWWQEGGVQAPMDVRMHDLSDGFAIVGPFSQKTKISGISTSAAQLRTDDGNTFVEVKAGQVTVKAPTKVILDTPEVHCTGKVTSVGDMIAGTISLQHHVHADPQGGSVSPPTP